MAAAGDFPKVDGDVYYGQDASQVWAAGAWSKNYYTGGDLYSILMFSATDWQTESRTTSDGGATWSAGGYGAGLNGIAVTCDADSTKAITVKTDGTGAELTTDSGGTWTAASTGLSNVTRIRGMAFRVTGMAVIWGIASSGKGAWYSTDGGDNWTQMTDTTLTTEMYAMDFIDVNDGIAIDSAKNILWTTAGVSSWADTLFDLTGGTGGSYIKLISSGPLITDIDAILIERGTGDGPGGSSGNAFTFDGSAAPIRRNTNIVGISDSTGISNILKTTTGNHYYALRIMNRDELSSGTVKDQEGTTILFRSSDNGVTWYSRILPTVTISRSSSTLPDWTRDTTSNMSYFGSIIAQFSNKILIYLDSGMMIEVDESYVN